MSNKDTVPFSGATTFTLFPKLPPELRLNIWKCALPGSRSVKVMRNPVVRLEMMGLRVSEILLEADFFKYDKDKSIKPFFSPISVSHEAREVAVGDYQVPFNGILGLEHLYFNLERDILFIQDLGTAKIVSQGLWDNYKLPNASKNSCGKLCHLMFGGQWQHVFNIWQHFGGLETFVVENSNVGLKWDENALSGFLREHFDASKDFQVRFMSANEMNKLAKLSINSNSKQDGKEEVSNEIGGGICYSHFDGPLFGKRL